MPELWMPGATRLDVGDHAPTDGGPAKAIPHVTWDQDTTAAKPLPLVPYTRLVDWFGRNPAGIPSAPHILWDPFEGRFTQFHPANSRSKSLADQPGGTRTNRAGSVVIQIEALFFPYCVWNGKTYPRLIDTPCKGWPELLAWIRSWGVPDRWPMGPLTTRGNRDEETWETKAGWYGHSQVPENDHTDPGSWPAFDTSQEDDMAVSDEDLKRIALAVLGYKGRMPDGSTDGQDVYAYIRNTKGQVAGLLAAVQALAGQVGTDVDTAEVVAAVKAAIAAAVVKVDVTVDDLTPGA